MPSERRRQRQQRVRHEAGDGDNPYFTSSVNAESAEHPALSEQVKTSAFGPSNNESSTKIGKNENLQDDYNKKSLSSTKTESTYHDSNYDNRRYENKNPGGNRQDGNYRGKGNYQSRRPKGLNQGSSKAPIATPVINSNVAFAEEREYEPVSIMPSSSPVTKPEPESVKYRRREVVTNWLQYDEIPSEDDSEQGDYLRGEDFAEVLKMSSMSGSGGYLHLKGEMSWGDVDASYLGSHGLGALKVADLVSALQTIPLHTLLDIPTKKLPVHTINYYTHLAEDQAKLHKPSTEYVTDIEVNEKLINSLRISSEQFDLTKNESNLPETRNIMDATLKFSSAFVSEPDDVDLDDLMKERTPEPSFGEPLTNQEEKETSNKRKKNKLKQAQDVSDKHNIISRVTPQNSIEDDQNAEILKNIIPSTSRPSVEKEQPSFNFGLPETAKQKPEFDFGLPKGQTLEDNVNKQATTTKTTSERELMTNKPKEEKEISKQPSIDLDKPVIENEKKPILLISKTETENLEDWLDSVLDD